MIYVRLYTQRGGFVSNGETFQTEAEAEAAIRAVLARSDHWIGGEIVDGTNRIRVVREAV